jgi:amidohydrolase
MSAEELKHEVQKSVDRMHGQLLAVSHEIHSNPELGFEELKAAALLAETLHAAGLGVVEGAYGLATAFASEFGPEGTPCVALLAEYDALPEIGHACGHNVIASASLGAALALFELGDRLPGRVRLLGTPAEERGAGKELMARRGAFDAVDAAMMVHPGGIDLINMPSLCIGEVEVDYHGEAAHASAMPERGVNALDALVLAYQAIAALRQHIKVTERIHGIITNGGQAPNVVPDLTSGHFYVRAGNADELVALKQRVQECFEAGARATGAKLTSRWSEVDYLEMRACWPLAQAYQANAESLGRTFFPYDKLPAGVAGSTDMGNVSQRVPSIHPIIATAPPHCTIHNAEFARWTNSEIADKAVLDGAKALAMTTLDFFCDPELRERSTRAFREASP